MQNRSVNEWITKDICTIQYANKEENSLWTKLQSLCHLWSDQLPVYAHLIHWSDSPREKFLALQDIDVSSYTCWNCEKDIKNPINNPSYLCDTLEKKCLYQKEIHSSNMFLYICLILQQKYLYSYYVRLHN